MDWRTSCVGNRTNYGTTVANEIRRPRLNAFLLQRRETLAERIVARRVAQLIAGDATDPPEASGDDSDPLESERTMTIRIVVPPSQASLFPKLLLSGTLVSMVVHLHSEHTVQAFGVATPVKIGSVAMHSDRVEYTLHVTPKQAEEIRVAHDISTYWFRPFPLKPDHRETFESADSLSTFILNHPDYRPANATDWIIGSNGKGVPAPSADS